MPGTGQDLAASTGALRIEDDDLVQLKESEDAAERAAAAALAHLPSETDMGVLLPGRGAGAAGSAAGASAADGGDEDDGGVGVDLGPEADAALEQFQELYKDAYLSRALQHLDEFLEAHPQLPRSAVARRLRDEAGIDLKVLRARAELVRHGLAECSDDEGWKLIQDDPDGLRLHYRGGPQTPTTHCFKSACELDCELQELLSMAREFDLVPTWNSYITQTNILQITSLVELLVYASVWLPWPFAERDVLIQAVGIDMLAEDGSLAISFSSPEGGIPAGVEPPAGYDARTHVQVLPGSCLRIVPLPPKTPGGKPRTKVVVVTMLDSGAWVPEAVITFVLRVFAPFFFTAVVKVINHSFDDPQAPLPSRIAERPELYGVMAERVKHFLAGHADAP